MTECIYQDQPSLIGREIAFLRVVINYTKKKECEKSKIKFIDHTIEIKSLYQERITVNEYHGLCPAARNIKQTYTPHTHT